MTNILDLTNAGGDHVTQQRNIVETFGACIAFFSPLPSDRLDTVAAIMRKRDAAVETFYRALSYCNASATHSMYNGLLVAAEFPLTDHEKDILAPCGVDERHIRSILSMAHIASYMRFTLNPWIMVDNYGEDVLSSLRDRGVIPSYISSHILHVAGIDKVESWASVAISGPGVVLLKKMCKTREILPYMWLACDYDKFIARLDMIIADNVGDPTIKGRKDLASRMRLEYAFSNLLGSDKVGDGWFSSEAKERRRENIERLLKS